MAKCKDCLHYEACSTFSKIINAAVDVEKGCEHFKDRTQFAEVVRCKDCKRWFPEQEERCKALNTEPFGWCCRMRNMHEISYREITQHKDFCSCGERRTDDY